MGKKSKHPKPPQAVASQNSSVPDKLPQEVMEVINQLPSEQRTQITQLLIHQHTIEETFSGPLPRPDDFARYDEIVPGAADRILTMAEKQQKMHGDAEDKAFANDKRRIYLSALLGISLMILAGFVTWLGSAIIALPIGLAGVLSIFTRRFFDWLGSRTPPK